MGRYAGGVMALVPQDLEQGSDAEGIHGMHVRGRAMGTIGISDVGEGIHGYIQTCEVHFCD